MKLSTGGTMQTPNLDNYPESDPHVEAADLNVIFNTEAFDTPPSSDQLPSLEGFGDSFNAEDAKEESPIGSTATSGQETPRLPWVFPHLTIASDGQVSIPSSPFSISLKREGEPSPTFLGGNLLFILSQPGD